MDQEHKKELAGNLENCWLPESMLPKIGNTIATLRINRCLDPDNIAEQLGWKLDFYKAVEAGTLCPDYSELAKLAGIYQLNVEDLVDHEEFIVSETNYPQLEDYQPSFAYCNTS